MKAEISQTNKTDKMDSDSIYRLNEKISSSLLVAQLDHIDPKTHEQVVDEIILKLDSKQKTHFSTFKQKYENLSFQYLPFDKKYDQLRLKLNELEIFHQNKATWYDSTQLKFDLMNSTFSFHILNDKNVLYDYQIENAIANAEDLMILTQMKAYLMTELDRLNRLNKDEVNIKSNNSLDSGIRDLKSTEDNQLPIVDMKMILCLKSARKLPTKYAKTLCISYIHNILTV